MHNAGCICPLTPLSMRTSGSRSGPWASDADARRSQTDARASFVFINRVPDFVEKGIPAAVVRRPHCNRDLKSVPVIPPFGRGRVRRGEHESIFQVVVALAPGP